MVESSNTFETKKQEILRLFYADEPLQAAEKFKQLVEEAGVEGSGVSEGQVVEFQATEEIRKLLTDVEILDAFREQIAGIESGADKSWTVYKDQEELKIFYKLEEGFANCTLYMEKVINAPMINLMAVLAEAQLYDQWIPLTKKSVVLGKVSNFRQSAEFHYKLPWPLHPRAMYIGACGI